MNDVVIEVTDRLAACDEVRRLRAEIAQLHERVELLDRLAYQDVLIDLPNRRGFLRQLEAAIDRVKPLRRPARPCCSSTSTASR